MKPRSAGVHRNAGPGAAGALWILSLAYLLAEVFTAAAWTTPYSFANDSISSLGVTTCETGACSPLHDVMNFAFIALGVVTMAGAILLRRHIENRRARIWILALAAVIAVSTASTGLFPANEGTLVHWSAVLPGFLARHLVLVVIAWHFRREKRVVAGWAAVCAFTGIVGAVLLVAQILQFGLGERLALYPLPMWMAVTGAAVLLAVLRRTIPDQAGTFRHNIRAALPSTLVLLHTNRFAAPSPIVSNTRRLGW